MQAWFESRDVFACSRTVAEQRRYRWRKLEDLSLDLLGRTARQVVLKYVRPLREHWRRKVWRVLATCVHWTLSYRQKLVKINNCFAALKTTRKA